MAKTLVADGISGNVCIFEGANDVVNNPMLRPGDVFFHSTLRYFRELITGATTINLPQRGPTGDATSGYAYDDTYVIATHNLGYVPMCFVADGTDVFPLVDYISYGAKESNRKLRLVITDTQILLRASGTYFYTWTVPARVLNLKFFLGVIF